MVGVTVVLQAKAKEVIGAAEVVVVTLTILQVDVTLHVHIIFVADIGVVVTVIVVIEIGTIVEYLEFIIPHIHNAVDEEPPLILLQ